jgi:hypothetical protein
VVTSSIAIATEAVVTTISGLSVVVTSTVGSTTLYSVYAAAASTGILLLVQPSTPQAQKHQPLLRQLAGQVTV